MAEIDELVQKILSQMGNSSSAAPAENTPAASASNPTVSATPEAEMGVKDYPLYEQHPELVKSPSGKSLEEITLENVLNNRVGSQDLRITKETLKRQGEIAKASGRAAIDQNFARAAELTAIPDARLLEIYGALRPYRSTKQELLDIADELDNQYSAKITADFIREAAQYYEVRKKLKGDN